MHEPFLLAALEQARLGRGICSPNPSVGAVAVRDGKIIAQTSHRGAGTPHAEQLLLKQLPEKLSDITLYVTLEPCNHWGRTPPCVQEIIDYGVKKVVYAYRDPNPIVIENNTPRILSEHGIDVLHYPLPVIDEFYRSYRHWSLTQKPWVTIKLAQTMDGKIAGPEGKRIQLSNALCAEFTHQQRLYSDVILTTARTVNLDDPLLNVRLPNVQLAKNVAVICGQTAPNPRAQLFTLAKHCHLFHDEHSLVPSLPDNVSAHPIQASQGLLNLESVISELGRLGYHDVWVEAGGVLFGALHLARLINRTYLYIAPTILGSTALSAYHHADIFNHASDITWHAMGDNAMARIDWAVAPAEETLCLPG